MLHKQVIPNARFGYASNYQREKSDGVKVLKVDNVYCEEKHGLAEAQLRSAFPEATEISVWSGKGKAEVSFETERGAEKAFWEARGLCVSGRPVTVTFKRA